MKQVLVEVICLAPEDWGLCNMCQTMMVQAGIGANFSISNLNDLPPEWKQELDAVSAWIFNTAKRYGAQVIFRIYDPRSLPGLLRSLRYGVHTYPAFIIAGRQRLLGVDVQQLDAVLAAYGLQPCEVEGNP